MEEYIGMIKLFAGNFAPRGWMFCNGERLDTGRFSALHSLLGETYGGDGGSFCLPDLRGLVPVGVVPGEPGDYYLGGKGGNKTVNLNVTQLPAHSHPATATATATSAINVSNANASTGTPVADTSVMAAPGTPEGRDFRSTFGFNQEAPNTKLASGSSTVTVDVAVNVGASTGTAAPVDIRQPFMGMNYIICVEGIYPSRS